MGTTAFKSLGSVIAITIMIPMGSSAMAVDVVDVDESILRQQVEVAVPACHSISSRALLAPEAEASLEFAVDSLNQINDGGCDIEGTQIRVADGLGVTVPQKGETVGAAGTLADGYKSIDELVVHRSDAGKIAVKVDYQGIAEPVTTGDRVAVHELAEYDDLEKRGEAEISPSAVGSIQSTATHFMCSNSAYKLFSGASRGVNGNHYKWYYSNSQEPVYAEGIISNAANNLSRGISPCSTSRSVIVGQAYSGKRAGGVSVRDDGTCGTVDTVNIVAWRKNLAPHLLGVTCWRGVSGVIVGADIALNGGKKWWTGGVCSMAYDLNAVAMHEFGHAVGLDHVSPSARQLMSPSFGQCETSRGRVGLGDLRGLRAIAAQWK